MAALEEQGESALSEIEVETQVGGTRRIGRNLADRVCRIFTCKRGN
jgi:hypothetical protein